MILPCNISSCILFEMLLLLTEMQNNSVIHLFSHCAKHTKRIKRLKIFYSIPNSLCLQGAKPVFQNSPWIEHHMKCRWQHCSACIHPHQPTSLLDHSIQRCEIDSTEEFSSFLELHITNGNNSKAWAEMEVEDRSQMSLGLRVNLA